MRQRASAQYKRTLTPQKHITMHTFLRNTFAALVPAVVIAAAAIFATSCEKDDDNHHYFGVTSQINGGPIVKAYADQTVDTLSIESTDTWKGTSEASWITFNDTKSQTESKTVQYVYRNIYTFSIPLTIGANTGSTLRSSIIKFDANGRTAGIQYQQAYWLNIIDPAPKFENEAASTGLKLEKEVTKSTLSTTIGFIIYNDATLASDADWARPATTEFSKGTNTVTIAMDDNTSGAARSAHLTLKSSTGAQSVITITQAK